MASKHTLDGLIKWSMRDGWAGRFEQVLEDHLMPACEETGLETDDVVATLGEDLFMSSVWACAFEDFLTREFDDGENAIDDYLRRRGWKESASVRSYLAALRNSTMSLHEVSDVVPGTSFRARDLIRGGEPVLISERSATRSLKPWERIAARVVQVGSKMQIGGGVLAFDHGTTATFIEGLRRFERLGNDEMRQLAETNADDFEDAAFAGLSPEERRHAIAPMLTTFWLVNVIDRVQAPPPELRNTDGDEYVLCELRYPFAARVTAKHIRAALEACPQFRAVNATNWNWISQDNPATASGTDKRSLTVETWHEDGELILGTIVLKNKAVVLSVNSRRRADLGHKLLSGIFGQRVGPHSVETHSVEQIMASRDVAEPQQPAIPEEELCAIIHGQMDRHYRKVLDEPVPALGGVTPRAAVKTQRGRVKVAEWLKLMENQTAKSGDHDGAMASYSFGWLWAELGISELRR
jgi:hypothetical protein